VDQTIKEATTRATAVNSVQITSTIQRHQGAAVLTSRLNQTTKIALIPLIITASSMDQTIKQATTRATAVNTVQITSTIQRHQGAQQALSANWPLFFCALCLCILVLAL
jgi:hypothetical protein